MTQDERWMAKYKEEVEFININHRNPLRHRIEEHDMLNCLKATRKRLNAGKLQDERREEFEALLELVEQYKHVNQWR